MRSASVVFALAVIAQWLVPLAGVWQHKQFMVRGTVARLECEASSSYDPLRGRFLDLWLAESGQFAPQGMPESGPVPVWATLAADAARLVHERYRAGRRPAAEIRILDGRALLVDVLVDGVSVRDVVKSPAR